MYNVCMQCSVVMLREKIISFSQAIRHGWNGARKMCAKMIMKTKENTFNYEQEDDGLSKYKKCR